MDILTKLGLLLLCGCQILAKSGFASEATTAKPRIPWQDSEGNHIFAHEGGISRFSDTYYWYGTSYNGNPSGAYGKAGHKVANGFRVYISRDLLNWTPAGVCLAVPTTGWGSTGTLHRPYVFFNPKTRKYVMWFFHFVKYPDAMLGVAIADIPTGPFQILGQRDTGEEHGWGQDLGGFQDDDGKAYIVYDDGHRNLRVDQLADDYLSSTKKTMVAMPRAHEGAAMIKWRGKYIVAGSGVCGWGNSDTQYVVADQPLGPYSVLRLMCPPGTATWRSQLSNFFYVPQSDTVYALCDRWWINSQGEQTKNLDNSAYHILSLRPVPGTGEYLMEYDPR